VSLIDPHASWDALTQCAATYGNSDTEQAIKQLVLEVRDHMECEIKGDVPGLKGRAAVEGFYTDMMARGGNQFQVVIDNVIASTSHVVTEGQVRSVYMADTLQSQGMTEVNGKAIDSSEIWMSEAQLVTVWPNDGAKQEFT